MEAALLVYVEVVIGRLLDHRRLEGGEDDLMRRWCGLWEFLFAILLLQSKTIPFRYSCALSFFTCCN
jgi:hypothetical protein